MKATGRIKSGGEGFACGKPEKRAEEREICIVKR